MSKNNESYVIKDIRIWISLDPSTLLVALENGEDPKAVAKDILNDALDYLRSNKDIEDYDIGQKDKVDDVEKVVEK